MATQTESIYTRNKDVWKATNRDILEAHCVKEGIDFTKDIIDVVHARYVAELQAAEEAKAKADAAEAERKKAAETTSTTPPTTHVTTPPTMEHPAEYSTKPLDEETRRVLDLAPRIGEVITTMWNTSSLGKGTPIVISAIEEKYKVHLGALSREVYEAYKASKGSEDTLQALIKQHAQRPTTPSSTRSSTPSTAIIPLESQKSSTNQTPQPIIAPNGVPSGVVSGPVGAVSGVPEGIVEVFERNLKLTTEQAISMAKRGPFISKGVTGTSNEGYCKVCRTLGEKTKLPVGEKAAEIVAEACRIRVYGGQ